MAELLTSDEEFKPRVGKRISDWLSIKRWKKDPRVIFLRYRGQPIPLNMNDAKRLRDWLDGVIP